MARTKLRSDRITALGNAERSVIAAALGTPSRRSG